MSSSEPETPAMGVSSMSLSPELKRVLMEELVQGRDSATKLKPLLLRLFSGSGSGSVLQEEELLLNIMKAFTHSLSLLTADRSLEVSQVGSADRRSEDSGGDSRKRPSFKDNRGCSKRRKNLQMRTTVTPTMEDGRAWRKYGQKLILNAKHPRAYFRCKHKYDQGCEATKQVQRLEDDDDDKQMYKTTYVNTHTCRDKVKNHRIVSDLDPIFDHQSKEEYKDSDKNITAIDSILWPDVLSFDSSEEHPLIACSDTSSQSLDMDFVVDSVDFDSVSVGDFNFDENGFV